MELGCLALLVVPKLAPELAGRAANPAVVGVVAEVEQDMDLPAEVAAIDFPVADIVDSGAALVADHIAVGVVAVAGIGLVAVEAQAVHIDLVVASEFEAGTDSAQAGHTAVAPVPAAVQIDPAVGLAVAATPDSPEPENSGPPSASCI